MWGFERGVLGVVRSVWFVVEAPVATTAVAATIEILKAEETMAVDVSGASPRTILSSESEIQVLTKIGTARYFN
jgi:hypothetical protein